jgi:uncharacterized protein (DUF433 family)
MNKGVKILMAQSKKKDKKSQSPPWMRRLYLPAYSVVESARYAGTSPQVAANWHYYKGKVGPAIPGKERGKPLSYLQLIEVAFVSTMRKENISLQKIRNAREYACQTFKVEYPFAELRWKTEGKHLLLELKDVLGELELGKLIVADKAGQEAWKPIMAERFKQFEYEENIALKWHVRGTENPIIIDPRISFGAPTVQGLPTWILKGRWLADETIEEIQDDFQIEPEYIKYALEFEGIEPELELVA